MVLSWSLFRICYNDMTIDSPCSWFLSMTFTPTVFAIPDVYPSDCSLNSLSEAFGLIKEHGYCRTSTKAFKPSGQCVLLHHFQITHVNTMPFSKKLSRPWRISLTTTKTNVGIHISHEWSSKTYRDDAVSVIIWRLLLMEIFNATKLCALLCLTHWTRPCSKTYMEYNLSSIEDNLQKRTVFAST